MVFQLIPQPISILFTLVFVVAIAFVLWKLRRRGKVYRLMFYAVTVLTVVFVIAEAWAMFTPT